MKEIEVKIRQRMVFEFHPFNHFGWFAVIQDFFPRVDDFPEMPKMYRRYYRKYKRYLRKHIDGPVTVEKVRKAMIQEMMIRLPEPMETVSIVTIKEDSIEQDIIYVQGYGINI